MSRDHQPRLLRLIDEVRERDRRDASKPQHGRTEYVCGAWLCVVTGKIGVLCGCVECRPRWT